MQKSITLIWGLMLVGLSQATCTQQYGNVTCGSGPVDSVHASGNVVLHNTTVVHDVNVSGNLDAQGSQLPVVQVQGGAALTQCAVAKSCRIEGGLVARNTEFSGALSIYANHAVLDSVTTQGIHMENTGSQPTVLSIGGNSKILGDIRVVPAGATIHVGPQVDIQGAVIGATVVKGEK